MGRLPDESVSRDSIASRLVSRRPMLLLAVALLFAGYLLLWFGVNVGPGVLPLWALLLALGFVASIGAVTSYFRAERSWSGPTLGNSVYGASAAPGGPPDLGRPHPYVAPVASEPVIREPMASVPVVRAPTTNEPAARAPLSRVAPRLDRSDGRPTAFPVRPESDLEPVRGPKDIDGEVGRILEELEGIEREVAPRRKTDASVDR